uniref:Uncharacterized protein n=1 Tax=Hordeum vulgare subsp. vulgare TaxID=112509 RepID=A0A8I6Y8M4_HORVV
MEFMLSGPAAPMFWKAPPYRLTQDTTVRVSNEDPMLLSIMHQQGVAKYTPIRNKRLTLRTVPESSGSVPIPLAVIAPANTVEYAPVEFGFSPFELEVTHRSYPALISLGLYESAMMLTSSSELGKSGSVYQVACIW